MHKQFSYSCTLYLCPVRNLTWCWNQRSNRLYSARNKGVGIDSNLMLSCIKREPDISINQTKWSFNSQRKLSSLAICNHFCYWIKKLGAWEINSYHHQHNRFRDRCMESNDMHNVIKYFHVSWLQSWRSYFSTWNNRNKERLGDKARFYSGIPKSSSSTHNWKAARYSTQQITVKSL